MSEAANPDVTIRFSGKGDEAINTAQAVDAVLGKLAKSAKVAHDSLTQASGAMDKVAASSSKVFSAAPQYQAMASAIVATGKAAQDTTDRMAKMAASATQAGQAVSSIKPPRSATTAATGAGIGMPARPSASFLTVPDPVAPTDDGGAAFAAAGMARATASALGLTVGLAAVANEVKNTISAAADLDRAMSGVAAVGALDKSGDQFAELTDLVRGMGATTQYSAVEAAGGLKELVAAGYSAVDAGRILSDVLNLAATEDMALGRASEIVVAGLQSLKMGVDEAARLTDVLARAANASTASVDDMGEALKFAAPTAAALGISIEDLSATFAILANSGVRGGMAGRGIGTVMARLVAPTKEATDTLAEFGLTSRDVNPQVVGLGTAFANLAKMDQSGLVRMFGAENLDISSILTANADGFDKMQDAMHDANITAKSMADLKMDNLHGDFKFLIAQINELRTELASGIYDDFRDTIQDVTTFLKEHRAEIVQVIRQGIQLGVVAGKVAAAYYAVVGAQKAITGGKLAAVWIAEATAIGNNTAMLRANAAARALANPAGLVVAGAVAGWFAGKGLGKLAVGSGGFEALTAQDTETENSSANASASRVALWIQGAKTAEDSERVRYALGKEIEMIERNIKEAKQRGAKEEVSALQSTLQLQRNRLANLDALIARAQEFAAAEQDAANKAAGDAAYERRLDNIIAKQKVVQANAEAFVKGMGALKEQLSGTDPLATQEADTAKELQSLVSKMSGAAGIMEPMLSDLPGYNKHSRFFRTDEKGAQEFIAFYRDTMAKIEASGNKDMFGNEEWQRMTAGVQRVMELEKNLASIRKKNAKESEELDKRKQAVTDYEKELAILEAKAAGDERRAASLELESKLLQEQANIRKSMGDQVTEAQASEMAAKKVMADAQIADREKAGIVARSLGSSAQGVNMLFGRSANAGALDAARAAREAHRQRDTQVSLLQEILKSFTNIPEPIIRFKPVFSKQ